MVYAGVGLCFIAAVVVLLFYLLGFFTAGPDFIRVSPEHPDARSTNKQIFKDFRLKQFGLNGVNYIHSDSEGATFNGDLLALAGENGQGPGKKRVDIKPSLKGTFELRLEFLVLLKKKINVTLFHHKKKILERDFPGNGFYTLNSTLKLNKGDRLTLLARGKGVVLLGTPVFYKKKPVQEREYVFLICADTLRADHLPTYGYTRETAPNFDAFSRDAVVFARAYAQAAWTLPSHMSLFTSLYEYNHGVRKEGVLFPRVRFLVEALSQSFVTRSLNGGAWVQAIFGFYRGFDYYKSYGRLGARPESAKTLFEKAREDLESHEFPRTFYFLHSYQIHSPYQPQRRFLDYFNSNPEYTRLSTPKHWVKKNINPKKIERVNNAMIDLYDGEIRSFDHWFGTFIHYLKKKKIYDRAMIIFMSDHGEEFYEHRNWGHDHSLYNEVVHVPLMIKFPKNKFKGTIIKNEVGLIDVMPTLLEYYHIPWNPETMPVDGIDLTRLIKGEPLQREIISSISSGYYYRRDAFKIAIIKNNVKLICNIPYEKAVAPGTSSSFQTVEYYDLSEDPLETVNLSATRRDEIKRFQALFNRIIKRGVYQLKQKGNRAVLDKKNRETLRSLGYL